jgi:23S rRNA (cytidine2498-2'-O)-methyltransferase
MEIENLFAGAVTGYLAPRDFLAHVLTETGEADFLVGRLSFNAGAALDSSWAQNVWLEPRLIEYSSIKDAASSLRAMQRNWALYPHTLHRRAELIVDALPSPFLFFPWAHSSS